MSKTFIWLFDWFFLSFSAVIDDTTKEIVYRDYVDISVAVATPKVISGASFFFLIIW